MELEPESIPTDPFLDLPIEETPLNRLLPIVQPREGRWRGGLFHLLAIVIIVGYAFFLASFWAPAIGRPGIDENCYLVAGKNIAFTGTPGFKPVDDFQFISAMWVRTNAETAAPPAWVPWPLRKWLTVNVEAGWYYPKYPVGLSLLDAIAIRLGGDPHTLVARGAAFLVSPVCMVLAMLGMFYLARAILGSWFYALLATIVLATIPTSLEFAEIPNSHPPALCFVVWGMFFLTRFWQTGSWRKGLIAGLLLGFAVTIRYSEALLMFPLYPLDKVLSDTKIAENHPSIWMLIKACRMIPFGPIGLACVLSVRWKRPRSYLRAASPAIGWVIVVGALVAFNWFSMGHITGYDATNESGGFTSEMFLNKWEFTVQQLYMYGLLFLFPLGIAGLFFMFRGAARSAMLLTMWFLPGTLLYIAYYWGEQTPGIGYLRFFLTLFPPLIIGAFWLMRAAESTSLGRERWGFSIAAPIGAGFLTAATAAIGIYYSTPDIALQHRGNLNLAYTAREIDSVVNHDAASPGRFIVFADQGLLPMSLHYESFMFDGDWYASDGFDKRMAGGLGIIAVLQSKDPKGPKLIQEDRINYMKDVRDKLSEADLRAAQNSTMARAIDSGKNVYAILTSLEFEKFRRTYIDGSQFTMKERRHWSEPCNVPIPGRRERSAWLAAPFDSGEPLIRWRPQVLTMYEITRNVPGPTTAAITATTQSATTQPSTQPTTRP